MSFLADVWCPSQILKRHGPSRRFLHPICSNIVSLLLTNVTHLLPMMCPINIYSANLIAPLLNLLSKVALAFVLSSSHANTIFLEKIMGARQTFPWTACILLGLIVFRRSLFRILPCCGWVWRSFWNHLDPYLYPNPRYPLCLCLVTLLWPSPRLASNDRYSLCSIFDICHLSQHISIQLLWSECYSSRQCNRTFSRRHM